MPVDIVKSIHIMTPQKTASGNDYNHSNIGKYAGTAAGVATGGHFLYTFNKIKKDPKFYEAVNSFAKNTIDQLVEIFGGTKLTPEELEQEIPKYMKKFINRGAYLAAGVFVALGLGLGAIGDSIANHFIKKNADKKVQSAK